MSIGTSDKDFEHTTIGSKKIKNRNFQKNAINQVFLKRPKNRVSNRAKCRDSTKVSVKIAGSNP